MKRNLKHLAPALAILFSFPLLFISCSSSSIKTNLLNNSYKSNIVSNSQTNDAIIRLVDNGNFFCTGFVIDDNYALTAAHCVDRSSFLNDYDPKTIQIENQKGELVLSDVLVAGVNGSQDYAILKGNFTTFKKLQIDAVNLPPVTATSSIYEACGFPAGQKQLVCTLLYPIGNEYFYIRANGGGIYKGMSGGPVFDKRTNKVVGVNSHVGENFVAFGPLVGLLAQFGIEEK